MCQIVSNYYITIILMLSNAYNLVYRMLVISMQWSVDLFKYNQHVTFHSPMVSLFYIATPFILTISL